MSDVDCRIGSKDVFGWVSYEFVLPSPTARRSAGNAIACLRACLLASHTETTHREFPTACFGNLIRCWIRFFCAHVGCACGVWRQCSFNGSATMPMRAAQLQYATNDSEMGTCKLLLTLSHSGVRAVVARSGRLRARATHTKTTHTFCKHARSRRDRHSHPERALRISANAC